MKKLMIFCDYFGNGGIEKIVTYINKNIDKTKFSSQILCTIKNSQVFNDEVCSISNKKYRNPVYRFIKTSFNIKKYTVNSDIVNFNIHSPVGLFYAFLIKNTEKKIVIYAHNSNFDNNILKIKTLIASIFKLMFSSKKYTYIACSNQAAQFCFKKNTKYEIVKSEIDGKKYLYNIDKRKEVRKKHNIGEEDIVIGNIGRLCKQKNQEFLIKVFIELSKINKNVKLCLIGTGKQENKIKRIINKNDLKNEVLIIEKEKNIENMYQMFDCYVSTSKYEGYGLTIYEALCASLKCFIPIDVSVNFDNKNIIKMSLNDSPHKWAEIINKEIRYERKICNIENEDQYINQIEKIYMR